ncbi:MULTISPECIES: hypothetical protein [unclassified Dolichospermum]|uniref:hypothetical protein n=1 Tax=unclassified Dolichospermum TaxID=2622029 RepID=UPI001445809E|nr:MULTISPECIES: hypothetical protein [unclassified Dolichospermum]MTJ15850.1 hypothetical protein [Dolichospermum sp. UHCC 0299]MTJ41619.1 hypothetical protein [Dolichospermum sp. UHCC 0406]
MTNLITLQTIFIKDDVSIRLNKLDNHLKQIQCLLLDSNNNDVVKSLITETMYFIEWIAPDIEFDYAFELANLGRFLTRWLFRWEQIWNDTEARNQVNQELGSWNDFVLQMSQLFAA